MEILVDEGSLQIGGEEIPNSEEDPRGYSG
jgi:hypothetical protein